MGYATREQIEALLLPLADNSCVRCRFFEKFEEAVYHVVGDWTCVKIEGRCHRFPPSFHDDDVDEDCYPIVCDSDWCGEFQPTTDDRGIEYLLADHLK